MTKKKSGMTVKTDLSNIFTDGKAKASKKALPSKKGEISINEALGVVLKQMKATGHRARTISDYELHVNHFMLITGAANLVDVSNVLIYQWLSSMEVGEQTKLTRLKCLKAFLGRCFNNGWFDSRFWTSVVVKVDSPVKKGVKERDVYALLNLLDLTDYVELRDATAILLMYQTGIRIGTLAQLEESSIDLAEQTLRVDGSLVKNHDRLLLPLSDQLTRLLEALIEQNGIVRMENKVENNQLFLTRSGNKTSNTPTNNTIQKRMRVYCNRYGFKDINPHAIRRGFAKDLLDKGYHIAFISKALGHKDISTTTRYLYIDKEEIVSVLRKRF